MMDAAQFQDITDQRLAAGPLSNVPTVLKHCWDVDRLSDLYAKIKQDTDHRLALISRRMDQIRGS